MDVFYLILNHNPHIAIVGYINGISSKKRQLRTVCEREAGVNTKSHLD